MSDPVNVNTADRAALDAVPALAGHGYEIVRYRKVAGGSPRYASWTRYRGWLASWTMRRERD